MSLVFFTHLRALTIKETRQILRDKSAVLLGVVLPLILIVLFGSGMSFDIKDIRLGVVNVEKTAQTTFFTQVLNANKTFKVTPFASRYEGQAALSRFEIEALVVFDRKNEAQLLIDGTEAPRATTISTAVMGTISSAQTAHGQQTRGVTITPRIWFNEGAESRWYLVPGLLVMILMMSGTLLTGLVIAREWERGTMEALLATPVSPLALLLSKVIPYFVLSMAGWGLCLLVAIFFYEVPLRGGLGVITISSILYTLFCLGLGLVISAVTRSQFLACQASLLVSFLPSMILSGFIFDLRSAPVAAEILGRSLPPANFLDVLKVGFLTGGMPELVVEKLLILTGFAILSLALALKLCQKRIRK